MNTLTVAFAMLGMLSHGTAQAVRTSTPTVRVAAATVAPSCCPPAKACADCCASGSCAACCPSGAACCNPDGTCSAGCCGAASCCP